MFATIWHGLPLDMSVAGYVSVFPGILLLASVWCPGKWTKKVLEVYTTVLLAVVALAVVADNMLFPYWGYHLDKSVFVFLVTPKDALASAEIWQVVALPLLAALVWGAYMGIYRKMVSKRMEKELQKPHFRISSSLGLLLATALLFLPIRGSLTVSTMNTGRAYFSTNSLLNAAAVNPVFHCIESLSENDFAVEKYTYMPSDEAQAIVADMLHPGDTLQSSPSLLLREPTNIILVIMESFSANAVGCLNDGVGATPSIDSLSKESVLFMNAYASGYRTDRGVVSVLSAFPSQPTSSLMTVPQKSQHLGFFSKELQRMGYQPHFYYGGDEDFTNMRSYLIAGGFDDRLCDHSFPIEQRLSKWGVPDHYVLDRAAQTITARPEGERHLDVVLTLSSHEPFEVPASKLFDSPYLNSIAYTDSALGAFVQQLRAADRWDNTLLLLVADHGYRYPESVAYNSPERYHILMMMSGGAVRSSQQVETLCSQTDFLPTVLHSLGEDSTEDVFPLSKDIFASAAPWAFYVYNDGFVLMTPNDTTRVSGASGKKEAGSALGEGQAKAFMQAVYEQIERL